MNRESALARLRAEHFDILVVGGGATGLGCALDAVSRGYSTALVEADDFAKATSSRSTKLVHGGVRYLRAGNFALVREALIERTRLRANAPEYVRELAFLVPTLNAVERAYYAAGLKLYDALAGASGFPRSRLVNDGVMYWDAQFDDARLAIALARTSYALGAAVANYVRVDGLLQERGRLSGARVTDRETGERFVISARTVINATGIFADTLRRMDDASITPLLTFSRGSHIVVGASALRDPSTALLVPRTPDGRVLFVIPWHDHALIGTTDVATPAAAIDPVPSREEIDYIMLTANRYLTEPIGYGDIRTVFAGLRPLVNRKTAGTAALSREHLVSLSRSGLVTITGGKWTTYRRMAQDAVDAAARSSTLATAPCRTTDLRIQSDDSPQDEAARIAHAVEHEMARTLEDFLARRTGVLFVDAREAQKEAPFAISELARRLGRDDAWAREELRKFNAIALTFQTA